MPTAKRDAVRETVAANLLPTLSEHPLFASLAVLVSSDPRRGGWQVSVVALDPELSWSGAEIPLDPVVLDGLRAVLQQL